MTIKIYKTLSLLGLGVGAFLGLLGHKLGPLLIIVGFLIGLVVSLWELEDRVKAIEDNKNA